MGAVDALIAQLCIGNGLTLLTTDPDFSRCKALQAQSLVAAGEARCLNPGTETSAPTKQRRYAFDSPIKSVARMVSMRSTERRRKDARPGAADNVPRACGLG